MAALLVCPSRRCDTPQAFRVPANIRRNALERKYERMAERRAPPSMPHGLGDYRAAVRGVVPLATSFWTRQLISSATQISFSEGHAIP
jgi:hypothetical protein